MGRRSIGGTAGLFMVGDGGAGRWSRPSDGAELACGMPERLGDMPPSWGVSQLEGDPVAAGGCQEPCAEGWDMDGMKSTGRSEKSSWSSVGMAIGPMPWWTCGAARWWIEARACVTEDPDLNSAECRDGVGAVREERTCGFICEYGIAIAEMSGLRWKRPRRKPAGQLHRQGHRLSVGRAPKSVVDVHLHSTSPMHDHVCAQIGQ